MTAGQEKTQQVTGVGEAAITTCVSSGYKLKKKNDSGNRTNAAAVKTEQFRPRTVRAAVAGILRNFQIVKSCAE